MKKFWNVVSIYINSFAMIFFGQIRRWSGKEKSGYGDVFIKTN